MISKEQFMLRQPAAPEETKTDTYYYELCKRLADEAAKRGLFPSFPAKAVERAALAVTGYYQDVIADAGVWRSFINECRRLYGYTVPFYEDKQEDYTDYELNRADVRFMVWYALAMNCEEMRGCDPMMAELLEGADEWYSVLESVYDDAPIPEDYRICHELELHAPEDRDALYKLGNWLFMHCYLMTPAYALTLREMAAQVDLRSEEGMHKLQELMERSMGEDPTGPLALYLGEWLHLIVRGKMPKAPKTPGQAEHKYYTAFTRATEGDVIKFFGTYEELNRFFIEALGWAGGEEHLPQLKGAHDFILMVDRYKGMLLAKDIARCIAAPQNPYYDRGYARQHAMELLTVRGCCPGDLLKYVCVNGWLPDAVFNGSDNHELVRDNWDFVARCFLQQYYRGD